MDNHDRIAAALMWDEFETGGSCRGCGQPWVDGQLWASQGTLHFTDEQRELYEAEDARFQRGHGECGQGRHTMHASLTCTAGVLSAPAALTAAGRDCRADLQDIEPAPES